jgi:hypothetical protein
MRISYVSNITNCDKYGVPFNTEWHVGKTLEKLGHEVKFIQENSIAHGTLPDLVKGSDMFLWTRTWSDRVTEADLRTIEAMGIPTVSFHLDLYSNIARDGGLGIKSPFWSTQYVFSPEGSEEAESIFRTNGIRQFYLPPGVFEDECTYEPTELLHDIVFVGGGTEYSHPEWPYRGKLVSWLKETYGERFHKFGGADKFVRGKELNELYASSKIVIGDSLCKDFTDSYYWSDRAFETTGRGGMLIHPYIPGITDHFVDRKEAVFYAFDNFVQLKNLIDYYLDPEHDDEREAIRLAGFERTKRENTYHNRMKTMFDILEREGAFKKPQLAEISLMSDGSFEPGFEPIRVNLGAGSEPTEGWVNTDWLPLEGIQKVFNLLEYPWPFEDNSVDELKCIDVIEHMPNFTADNKSAPIEFIRECWRVLKPGGKLFMTTPHWQSPNCWVDLTHTRGFDKRSMDYFDPNTDIGKAYGYYSDRKFRVESSVSIMENQTDPADNGKPSNVTFKMTKI